MRGRCRDGRAAPYGKVLSCGHRADARGVLVVVEGLDGTGKTTLSRGLARALRARWLTTPSPVLRRVRAVLERELGRDPDARQLLYAATVVAAASRIRAWLRAGHVVVVDRYWPSTVAYVRPGARLNLTAVERLIPAANVTIWLTLDERGRRERLSVRGTGEGSCVDKRRLECPAIRSRVLRRYRSVLRRRVTGRLLEVHVGGRKPREVLAQVLAELARWGLHPLTARVARPARNGCVAVHAPHVAATTRDAPRIAARRGAHRGSRPSRVLWPARGSRNRCRRTNAVSTSRSSRVSSSPNAGMRCNAPYCVRAPGSAI